MRDMVGIALIVIAAGIGFFMGWTMNGMRQATNAMREWGMRERP